VTLASISHSTSQLIFLAEENPFPLQKPSHLRESQLIALLSERYAVELLCHETRVGAGIKKDAYGKVPSGLKVTAIPRQRQGIAEWLINRIQPKPMQAKSAAMVQALRERAAPGVVLWVSQLQMAPYIPLAKELGYLVILDEHCIESSLRAERALLSLKSLPGLVGAAGCGYLEGNYCEDSDAVVVSTDLDASRLLKLAPRARVHVLPNTVDSETMTASSGVPGQTVLFWGGTDCDQDAQGLLWFTEKVWPRVSSVLGTALPTLVATGQGLSEESQQRLKQAGVEVFSEETPAQLLQAKIVVFPYDHSGSGIRARILEAMAASRAVVSTPRAAEGLVLSPSFDVWIADQTDRFASAIVRLLNDESLRNTTAANAARTVRSRYDRSIARQKVTDLVEQVIQRRSEASKSSNNA